VCYTGTVNHEAGLVCYTGTLKHEAGLVCYMGTVNHEAGLVYVTRGLSSMKQDGCSLRRGNVYVSLLTFSVILITFYLLSHCYTSFLALKKPSLHYKTSEENAINNLIQ
jgi:hypothetical protein